MAFSDELDGGKVDGDPIILCEKQTYLGPLFIIS